MFGGRCSLVYLRLSKDNNYIHIIIEFRVGGGGGPL